MTSFHVSLTAILFFLAVTNAPKDAKEIQVTGPYFSAHWKLNEEGWKGGQYHLKDLWSIEDGTIVKTEGGPFAGKNDVAWEVRPAIGHDWNQKSKVELPHFADVEKTKDGFVYTARQADKETKYDISYNNDGSPYTDIPLLDWLHPIKESHAEMLPKWTPHDVAPVPISLGRALALVKEEFEKIPSKPTIKDIQFINGRSDASQEIWYYNFMCEIEHFTPRHTIDFYEVLVLLDGTVLTPQPALPPEHCTP